MVPQVSLKQISTRPSYWSDPPTSLMSVSLHITNKTDMHEMLQYCYINFLTVKTQHTLCSALNSNIFTMDAVVLAGISTAQKT